LRICAASGSHGDPIWWCGNRNKFRQHLEIAVRRKPAGVIPEAASQASLRSLRTLGCVRLSGIPAKCSNWIPGSGLRPAPE
jgi:hypothetical protein